MALGVQYWYAVTALLYVAGPVLGCGGMVAAIEWMGNCDGSSDQ